MTPERVARVLPVSFRRVALALVTATALAGCGSDAASLPSVAQSTVPSSAPSASGSRQADHPSPGPPSVTPRSSVASTPTPTPGNVQLAGSPELVLFQRQGVDLHLLGWRAGEAGLGIRQVIPGALRGVDPQQDYLPQLSADGSMLLVQVQPATSDAQDLFRAFRLEGTTGRQVWESSALGSGLTGSFIGAGQIVVTSAAPLPMGRGWTIVDLRSDHAVIHEMALPPVPRPSPGTSINLETQTFNYVPLGASADGRWVYALSAHATEPLYRVAYRIAIDTGEAQPVTAAPTTGPSRVVSPLLDPISGRLLLAGPRLTAASGRVEAWSSGSKTPDFTAAFKVIFTARWLDDGGVVLADYDRVPGPFTFRVVTLTATGEPNATLYSAQGTNAGLVGVQRGFAAAYVASEGSGVRTLVVTRVADGAVSALDVPEPSGLNFTLGLRP